MDSDHDSRIDPDWIPDEDDVDHEYSLDDGELDEASMVALERGRQTAILASVVVAAIASVSYRGPMAPYSLDLPEVTKRKKYGITGNRHNPSLI